MGNDGQWGLERLMQDYGIYIFFNFSREVCIPISLIFSGS